MKPVRLGDMSVGFVHTLADAITHHGLDPQPLLLQYGLDPARLAEAGARLSIPRYMRLGHAAIQLTGDPGLGLRMGQLSRLNQAGLAGVTAAQAPNVREAARTLTRFEALYGSNYRGQSSFHEDAEGAWLRFYSISPYNAYNRFVVDSIIAGWLHQLSSLAQQPVQAQRIEIEFEAPDYSEQYRALGDSPLHFGADANQLRLSQPTLALRNPQHCPSTWQLLLQLCERELEQLTRTRSLRERITRLLGPMLHGGREPDLEEVAARGKIFIGLDVYNVEPLPHNSPLRGLENVFLVPHLGGPTPDRYRICGKHALANLRAYHLGRPLTSIVGLREYDRMT